MQYWAWSGCCVMVNNGAGRTLAVYQLQSHLAALCRWVKQPDLDAVASYGSYQCQLSHATPQSGYSSWTWFAVAVCEAVSINLQFMQDCRIAVQVVETAAPGPIMYLVFQLSALINS